MSQQISKGIQKQRRKSVHNESSDLPLVINHGLLQDTLTDNLNNDTILAKNDLPTFRESFRNMNLEQTVDFEEGKINFGLSPQSKRQLPPLKIVPTSVRVGQQSPMQARFVEEVPKEFQEESKQEAKVEQDDDSDESQRAFKVKLSGHTEAQRNLISNVINIFRKQDNVEHQKCKEHIHGGITNKPFEIEMSLDGAPFYFKELDRKFVVYDQRSLGIFDAKGWFRRKVVWLTCWPWFDNFIIIVIAFNSLLLAATDYGDRDNQTPRNQWIETSGLIFSGIFTLEAIIKILAMGFIIHKNSYLRDPWNWLDFVVVIIGIIEYIPAIPAANLKALRTFRVLRPLRSINAFPSMRRLISSLLASLPSLGNAVIFMLFIFLLFGILGVQQFGGVLYQRCRYTPEPNKDPDTGLYTDWPIVEEIERLCGLNGQGNFRCPEPYFCGSPAQFELDLKTENLQDQQLISYGIVTFDNLLRALITIFQMITLEGWTDMMYNLSDASQAWMAIFFCVLLVVVGSFFLLNVILAVIMDAFDQVDQNSAANEAKVKNDLINLRRFHGIIDSDDEKSGDKEKEDDSGPDQPSQIRSPLNQIHVVDISADHQESRNIIVNLPNSNKFQERPKNICSVAPLSINSLPIQNSSLTSKKTMQKSKIIQIPQRAQNNKFLRFFFLICTSNAFNIGLTMCIIFNTALLAMDRHPIQPETQKFLETMNGVLSWVFFAEMVIKMIGLGIKGYAEDKFNLFDCTVVVISIIDVVISELGLEYNAGGAISALRAVRLLRVFKLARSWTSFRLLLEKMLITLKDIRNFSVLMLLFMFIYTLLGMELYAYRIIFNDENLDTVASEPGDFPRANFNTFLSGFTTIFIVLIGDDWNSTMYHHVRAKGNSAIFFFISLFILGNLVLLNLFLAILLKNFEEPPGKDEEANEDVEGIQTKIKNSITKCLNCLKSKQNKEKENDEKDDDEQKRRKMIMRKMSMKQKAMTVEIISTNKKEGIMETGLQSHDVTKHQNTIDKNILSNDGSDNVLILKSSPKSKVRILDKSKTIELRDTNSDFQQLKTQSFSLASLKKLQVQKSQQTKSKTIQLSGRALMILGKDNKLRQFCCKIVGHQYFDSFILLLILFSTILLTIENPLDDPNGNKNKILNKIDIVVTTIFTLELILKVAVYGFLLNGTESYMRNSWNIMDCIIVIFSIISVVFSGVNLGIIKVLRMLRVLRPLRMISRNPGLRIAVQSLINAIPDIGNVLVVSLLFLLLFAILGTNFYKGTFFSCNTDNIPDQFVSQILDKFDCQDFGGEWVNVDQNFDNVFNSMVTLFNVMTTEGWIDVMWSAVDSNKIDKQPIKNNSKNQVFFFIIFMIVGSLFILNMFVGIVINVFNKEKETLQLNHLLTKIGSDWCDVLISCYNSKPEIVFSSTGNKWVDWCHKVAMNQIFDTGIFVCIVMNTICLGMSWYDEPDALNPILEQINLVFNIIYTIEMFIKLVGFGSDYFSDGWNNFDMVIVVSAWFGMIINSFPGLDIGSLTTVIRSFRISRIFKIIKKYKNLRILFYTFIGAIPQLTNVGGLLFLLLFLYSVLGVFLFSQVELQDALNVHANFQTFQGALITLLRMSTGESWNFIMYDCARARTISFDCVESQTYEDIQRDGIRGCGSKTKAYPFFISFMVVVSFIFLNLFIAIILESFNTTQDVEGLQVSQEALSKFNHLWSKFDPKGKGFLPVWQFPQLINMILMEEIKLFHNMREQIKHGQTDIQGAMDKVFMFNLLQDNNLFTVSASIENDFKDELEMLEDKSPDEVQLIFEKKMENVVNEQDFLQVNVRKLSMSPGQKRALDHKKNETRDLNKFIGSLEVPCYDKIKYYYYYDILEALSRKLFQILLSKARDELLVKEEKTNRSKLSINNSFSESEENGSGKTLNEVDQVEKEHLNDIRDGQLDQILLRLEQKGQTNNIFKYKEMQQLRAKRTMRVQDKLEQFGPDKSIIDSSQIIGAQIIFKYIRKQQEARKLREQNILRRSMIIQKEMVTQSDLSVDEQVPFLQQVMDQVKITDEDTKLEEIKVPEQMRVTAIESLEIKVTEMLREKAPEFVENKVSEYVRASALESLEIKVSEILKEKTPEFVKIQVAEQLSEEYLEPFEVNIPEQERKKTLEPVQVEEPLNFNPSIEQDIYDLMEENEEEMNISINYSPHSGPGNIQGKQWASNQKLINAQRDGTNSSQNRSYANCSMSMSDINQN